MELAVLGVVLDSGPWSNIGLEAVEAKRDDLFLLVTYFNWDGIKTKMTKHIRSCHLIAKPKLSPGGIHCLSIALWQWRCPVQPQ